MCCHTKIEAADQTCYLTQSQFSDTRPTGPGADSVMPGALGIPVFKTPVLFEWENYPRVERVSTSGVSFLRQTHYHHRLCSLALSLRVLCSMTVERRDVQHVKSIHTGNMSKATHFWRVQHLSCMENNSSQRQYTWSV